MTSSFEMVRLALRTLALSEPKRHETFMVNDRDAEFHEWRTRLYSGVVMWLYDSLPVGPKGFVAVSLTFRRSSFRNPLDSEKL